MEDAIFDILKIRSNCSLTERDLLDPIRHHWDAKADWLNRDTYLTYYALGEHFKPTSIAEIGTRFGYSLHSMICGSLKVTRAFSFDNGHDYATSCDYVRDHFSILHPKVDLTIVNKDTQKLQSLSYWIKGHVDLFHVDADHSMKGAHHDCTLAWRYVKPGGLLLVDDVLNGTAVKAGTDRFLAAAGIRGWILPCYRGLYMIPKPLGYPPSEVA